MQHKLFNDFLRTATIDQIIYVVLHKNNNKYNIWVVKNERCLSAILHPLVWRRDEKGDAFSLEDIKSYLTLETLCDFLDQKKWPDLPTSLRENAIFHLFSLKGWSRKKTFEDNLNHFTVIQYHCYIAGNVKTALEKAAESMEN